MKPLIEFGTDEQKSRLLPCIAEGGLGSLAITEESAGLHLAQEMKRNGYRVLVHDFAANRSNNPALNEFESLDELGGLEKREDVDLAVVCCPWPQYAKVKFSPKTKVLPTWGLTE